MFCQFRYPLYKWPYFDASYYQIYQLFIVGKTYYRNLNQAQEKKGISSPKLQRGDNFILTIYDYLTVDVLHNVVISPLFFW